MADNSSPGPVRDELGLLNASDQNVNYDGRSPRMRARPNLHNISFPRSSSRGTSDLSRAYSASERVSIGFRLSSSPGGAT